LTWDVEVIRSPQEYRVPGPCWLVKPVLTTSPPYGKDRMFAGSDPIHRTPVRRGRVAPAIELSAHAGDRAL
jgi:hypothetical protein